MFDRFRTREFSFKNLSINGKMVIGYVAILSLLIGVGVVSLLSLKTVNKLTNEIAHDILPSTRYAMNIAQTVAKFRIAQLEHLGATTEEEQTEWENAMEAYLDSIDKTYKLYSSFANSEQEKKLMKEFDTAWSGYTGAHVLFLSKSRQDQKEEARDALLGDAQKHFDAINKTIDDLIKVTGDMGEVVNGEVDATNKSSTMVILFAIVIACTVSVVIGFIISRSVMRPVSAAVNGLKEISSKVTSASGKIANTSAESLEGASQQASAIQETAASVQELTQMVGRNAENASRSNEITALSHQKASEGREVVDRMIHAVEDVSENSKSMMVQIEESNQRVSEISKVILGIEEKTKVINDIVFQTKLLSFNASVEAARAGEHGKGFAVVAEEVGNLARMSGSAAKEISDLLSDSTNKVHAIVDETRKKVAGLGHEARTKVEAALEVAQHCGAVLDEIVTHSGEVKGRMDEISTASREQAAGIQGIASATEQLDVVTHRAASNARESASFAADLSAQAVEMNEMVAQVSRAIFGQKTEQKSVEEATEFDDNQRAEPPEKNDAAA